MTTRREFLNTLSAAAAYAIAPTAFKSGLAVAREAPRAEAGTYLFSGVRVTSESLRRSAWAHLDEALVAEGHVLWRDAPEATHQLGLRGEGEARQLITQLADLRAGADVTVWRRVGQLQQFSLQQSVDHVDVTTHSDDVPQFFPSVRRAKLEGNVVVAYADLESLSHDLCDGLREMRLVMVDDRAAHELSFRAFASTLWVSDGVSDGLVSCGFSLTPSGPLTWGGESTVAMPVVKRRRCAYCGGELRGGGRSCKACGAPAWSEGAARCAYCGGYVMRGVGACGGCGAPSSSAAAYFFRGALQRLGVRG